MNFNKLQEYFVNYWHLDFFSLGASCGNIHIFRNIWGQFITTLVITNTDPSVQILDKDKGIFLGAFNFSEWTLVLKKIEQCHLLLEETNCNSQVSEYLDPFGFLHRNFSQFCLSLLGQNLFLTKRQGRTFAVFGEFLLKEKTSRMNIVTNKSQDYHYIRQISFYKWKYSGQIHKNRLCLFYNEDNTLEFTVDDVSKKVKKKYLPVTFTAAESHISKKRDQVKGGQKVFAFCCAAQGEKSRMKNRR